MHRPRPGAGKEREGAGRELMDLFDIHGDGGKGGQRLRDAGLVANLVQPPAPHAEIAGGGDAGDDQHRLGIRIGLADRGGGIGDARAGNQETDAGLAGDPGIAVGHEASALLVADADMADARRLDAAIGLQRMHAGHAKDGVHAIGAQQVHELRAAGNLRRHDPGFLR